MARKGGRRGRLAVKLALGAGITAFVGSLVAGALVVQNLAAGADGDAVRKAWLLAVMLSLVAGVAAGGISWMFGSQLGTRITDLGLAVAKLGRGGTEVKVRVSGNDEVGALGGALQYLASDLSALIKDQDSGGAVVTMDPLVRQLRDRAVPQGLPAVPGYEVDGAVSNGSRGGLDYFDLVVGDGGAVLYLISGEGSGALAVVACRMARDEVQRALQAGATPRKALSHANKVLQQTLPKGVCAKATLLQLGEAGAKLYQAGARAPLLICARGQVLELAAEGIALGLDEGPVFDKALRPQEVPAAPGTRLVLCNEAALRLDGFLDLLKANSPRHTAPFMNMTLGTIEQDAGEGGLREDVVLLTAKKT